MSLRDCGDCGARPGELHRQPCDVDVCPRCGCQGWSCECLADYGFDAEKYATKEEEDAAFEAAFAAYKAEWGGRRLPWAGEPVGAAEAREWGWFARFDGREIVPCGPDEPGAMPDLNRIAGLAVWDRDRGRFVRRPAGQ